MQPCRESGLRSSPGPRRPVDHAPHRRRNQAPSPIPGFAPLPARNARSPFQQVKNQAHEQAGQKAAREREVEREVSPLPYEVARKPAEVGHLAGNDERDADDEDHGAHADECSPDQP